MWSWNTAARRQTTEAAALIRVMSSVFELQIHPVGASAPPAGRWWKPEYWARWGTFRLVSWPQQKKNIHVYQPSMSPSTAVSGFSAVKQFSV